MNSLTQAIKIEIKKFFRIYSSKDEINDLGDYYKVKKWVQKVKVLYGVFSVIALIATIVEFVIACTFEGISEIPPIALCVLLPFFNFFFNWGWASLVLNFKDVVKSVMKSGASGYQAGEQVQTTHYQVRHEYANTYRVTAHTDNKGCLFAVFAGMGRFFLWAAFCIYVAPFLTLKKLKHNVENMRKFEAK